MINAKIVIGLGYGDEGKGVTTDHLAGYKDNSIIVRFNGGPQAGHTVTYGTYTHEFQNLGAGTFQNGNTYWSEFCPFNPISFMNEYDALYNLVDVPVFYLNVNSPVITPCDIHANRSDVHNVAHGSVQVGFGKSLQREEDHFHLHAGDLIYDYVINAKLRQIENYYGIPMLEHSFHTAVNTIQKLITKGRIVLVKSLREVVSITGIKDLIFEGSQGVLLDQIHGMFPHVTRSYCTPKNAMILLEQLGVAYSFYIYYVTRSYATRHGAGPLKYYEENNLIHTTSWNGEETNVDNQQGIFRKAPLSMEMLNYAVSCCRRYYNDATEYLVVTCLDQMGPTFSDGKIMKVPDIAKQLKISNTLECYSMDGDMKL